MNEKEKIEQIIAYCEKRLQECIEDDNPYDAASYADDIQTLKERLNKLLT